MKEIYVKDGDLFLVPNSAQKAETIISKIQSLVKGSEVDSIKLNLCGLNMFDALKIATMSGAYGLINNLNNRYEIIVDDEITKAQIQLLSLSNISVEVQEAEQTKRKAKELVVIV